MRKKDWRWQEGREEGRRNIESRKDEWREQRRNRKREEKLRGRSVRMEREEKR